MEKRVLAAALLSAIFLALYSQFVLKPTSGRAPAKGAPAPAPTAPSVSAKIEAEASSIHPIEQEEVIGIESSDLKVEVGATTGAIRSVILKKFPNGGVAEPLRIGSSLHLLEFFIKEGVFWDVTKAEPTRVTLTSHGAIEGHVLTYAMGDTGHVINVTLEAAPLREHTQNSAMMIATWAKADQLGDRDNPLETVLAVSENGVKTGYKRHLGTARIEKNVPRGTQQLSLTERYFCASIKPHNPLGDAKLLPSSHATIAVAASLAPEAEAPFHASVYYGPRDYFYLKRNGFEKAFHVGTLGQIGLILLSILGWLAGLTKSYGIAIIALSALVTCAMAPFTLAGFRSMRRMQALKPQIDKLMADHKNDPTAANKEVLALYKKHKVSPIGGCLPMVLQIPVFIALFQTISHSIGLRGQRFLWIADLSLPDRLLQLPVTLPLIGHYFNLLPILMAGVMYFQTKQSQQNMSTAGTANPTANLMAGPMMPIMFGVMFYQVSSGLVLYWITNSVMAMIWYRVAK